MSKKNALDQYYTKSEVAEKCYNVAKKYLQGNSFCEPCAGTGSFFNLMPEDNRLGMDLEPKVSGKGMIESPQDFLKFKDSLKGFDVISNPPFGFACSLAIDFFNHCAELGAETISFIIPKTFRKASIVNKLHNKFHLVYDFELEKNSFILDGKPYDVPCCFQVWCRKKETRPEINTSSVNEFMEFCNKEDADLAIRRAGGRAGKLLEGTDHTESSTYFVKSLIDINQLVGMLNSIDLTKEATNTAGVRSVSKYEIVNALKAL